MVELCWQSWGLSQPLEYSLVRKRVLDVKGAFSYATPALAETAICILESLRENGCIRSLRTCATS